MPSSSSSSKSERGMAGPPRPRALTSGRTALLKRVVGLVRTIVRLPERSVRWKILAPFVGLSLLVALLGTYVVTNLVTGSLQERFSNQLDESARAASDSLVRQERDHLEVLRAITFTEGAATTTAAGDAQTLEHLVLPHAANAGIQRVDVVDASGTLVYATQLVDERKLEYGLPAATVDLASWTAVQRVLAGDVDGNGDKFAEIVLDGQEYWFITAGPLKVGSQVVGAVVVGSRVDSVLAASKAETLSDVTFYTQDWTPIGSTLSVGEGGLAEALAVTVRQAGEGQGLSLNGRDYEFRFGELRLRSEPVGYFSVALPSSFIASANATTRLEMTIFFAVLMVVVTLLGWRLARRSTAPLSQLVATARTVTGGDLTARSNITLSDEIGELATTFDRMTDALREQMLGSIKALVSAIDARDSYTRGHSLRVGHLSAAIGAALGLSEVERHYLQVGGYLHDIGKIGIRDEVLLKAGALSDEERATIQEHPGISYEILAPVGLPEPVWQAVAFHHERLNGSGYPLGLSDEEITIYPRIVMVADVYDALVTDRPYRDALPVEKVLAHLRKEAMAGRIDADVVAAVSQISATWELRWRKDPSMSGVRTDTPAISSAVFTRKAG